MQNNYKELIFTTRRRLREKHSSPKSNTFLKIDKNNFNPYAFDSLFVDKTFNKIIEMENSSEVIINPLAQLIDYDFFDRLTDRDKERYILNLSSLYLEIKNSIICTA